MCYDGLKRGGSEIDKPSPISDAQEVWAQENTLIQPNPFHALEEDGASPWLGLPLALTPGIFQAWLLY